MRHIDNQNKLERDVNECNEYNEKYGKHLSYGYYTAYKANRWLEQEWLDILSQRRRKQIKESMK